MSMEHISEGTKHAESRGVPGAFDSPGLEQDETPLASVTFESGRKLLRESAASKPPRVETSVRPPKPQPTFWDRFAEKLDNLKNKIPNGFFRSLCSYLLSIVPSNDVRVAAANVDVIETNVLGRRDGAVDRLLENPKKLTSVFDQLSACLRNEDPDARRAAAHLFGYMESRSEDVVRVLNKLKKDPDLGVRLSACVGIERVNPSTQSTVLHRFTLNEGNVPCTVELLVPTEINKDVKRMNTISKRAFRDVERRGGEIFDAEDIWEAASDDFEFMSQAVLGVRDNSGKIIAFVIVSDEFEEEKRCAHIMCLGVEPKMQNHGIAGELLTTMEKWFAQVGYRYLVRECRIEHGWADKVEKNLKKRGLLVNGETEEIDSDFGVLRKMFMRLPKSK